jgi:hypothetical protein
VSCPAGKHVFGGGVSSFTSAGDLVPVIESFPSTDSIGNDIWAVELQGGSSATDTVHFTIYAICATTS